MPELHPSISGLRLQDALTSKGHWESTGSSSIEHPRYEEVHKQCYALPIEVIQTKKGPMGNRPTRTLIIGLFLTSNRAIPRQGLGDEWAREYVYIWYTVIFCTDMFERNCCAPSCDILQPHLGEDTRPHDPLGNLQSVLQGDGADDGVESAGEDSLLARPFKILGLERMRGQQGKKKKT